MLKKVVGSLIVASALSIGFGAAPSEASEWNQSSVKVEQTNSGWERMTETQRERMDESKSEIRGSISSMQRHSVNISSYQLQTGRSTGAATATQKSDINLDVNNELTNDSTELKQSTKGSGMIEQSTSSKNAAFLLQSQRNTTAVYHFQASIEGGPSIQNQMTQFITFNFHLLLKNKVTLLQVECGDLRL